VFVELMPLLAGRAVMITVARLDDRTLRVNVIPTKTSESENAALTTPLSYTGAPEELDRELGNGLLAVFKSEDAIEGCFEEAQGMMELTPEPSLIIPLVADQPRSVQTAFRTLGVVCDTLAAASRLIDRMPGNDQWVIQGGNDGGASEDRR